MLSLFILFVIIIFKAEARGPDNDPVEITFKIHESAVHVICDHTENDVFNTSYTVLEEEIFKINVKSDSVIHDVICNDHNHSPIHMENSDLKNVSTFKAERGMGTLWNCMVLLHRDNTTTFPAFQYKNAIYAVTYCYMKIHVRQRKSPQTILVNNMVLQAVRTDLSVKDVDLISEYHYADGDVVNVTCVNFLDRAALEVEFAMAGTISDESTMNSLYTFRMIGFVAKLHSGHNHSYMKCISTSFDYSLPIDYTTVMVRFVMRTEFNKISVRINGMTVRPKLKIVGNKYYEIEYKYDSLHPINVVCEVQRTDMKLVVVDYDFLGGHVSSYKKTELIPTKKAEMSFYLNSTDNKELFCVSEGASVEQINIHFTAGNFPIEEYPLHMKLPTKGTVMELYGDASGIKVIYYEFYDGETLQLKCGPLLLPNNGARPYMYLEFIGSDRCRTDGCFVSKSLKVSRENNNTEIVCYLMGPIDAYGSNDEHSIVLSEIRVILRERVLTTPSATTTTTSPVTTSTAADAASSATSTSSNTLLYCVSAAGVAVIAVLVVGGYWTVKKRFCCVRSTSQELPLPTPRPDPASVFYLNLLSVFQPMNEREAAELENDYEEVQ